MGKTDTIKKRRVDVYLRSKQQKERWNHISKQRGIPLSKLIINVMETHIGEDLVDQIEKREALTNINQKLTEENESLSFKIRRLENYISILEKEISRSKSISFVESGPGFRFHNQELITILKESTIPVSSHDICRQIKIDPSDTNLVQGISNQLEALSAYGLIKYDSRGWTWIG